MLGGLIRGVRGGVRGGGGGGGGDEGGRIRILYFTVAHERFVILLNL